MSDARPPRRRLRRFLLLVAAGLALLLASLPLFVVPAVDEPEEVRSGPVDAVLVLGGGQGERLTTAVALLPRLPDPAPTLLLSVPHGEPLVTCGEVPGRPEVAVRCLVPDPATTSGEAEQVATIAREEGWERVVVVTSDYHVTRTRMLVGRCGDRLATDTRWLYVAAETQRLSPRGLWQVATEWPSLLATPWDHQPACRGEPGFTTD